MSRSATSKLWTSFRNLSESDGISSYTARFRDRTTETAYIDHIVKTALHSERFIWYAVVAIFASYAVLDVLTIKEGLQEVLLIRLATLLALIAVIPFSFIPVLRPYFGWFSASGLVTTSVAIVLMIAILPVDGAPPYIIGVLVTFIAASCFMKIQFFLGVATYTSVSILYLGLLHFDDKFPSSDVIAMNFFTISIALAAILTNYFQEVRSRKIWQRDQQRMRDNATIEELLIEATAADRSKINFLSMMSHELRTPLHQIIGYTEVVTNAFKATDADNDNVDHLNEIHGSAHILLARIQKMLRYADATAGKMNYEIETTSVSELVEASLEQMRKALDKKSMKVDTEALAKARIPIDIVHSCYALNNILENAINASPDGAQLYISGEPAEDGGYVLNVRDEGPGMSDEQIAQALNPFTQGEGALARSREGLGLGLTLASQIFKAQNGEIKLTSDGQAGTTATIRFTPPAAEEAPKQAAE